MKLVNLDDKVINLENFGNNNGFEVEEVRTSIENKFPVEKLSVPKAKFVKPSIVHHSNMIHDNMIEDEDINDIANPFENKEDLFFIDPIENLTDEEKKDLENFNIGIQLEQFRSNIDNIFQMQDFSDFVDFDDF